MFVLYLPFIDSIFRQANTPFSQNRQYPTPFYLSVLYYHGNPRLLRESILLPDSTIFSPIAILSAASKNTKKWGPPPTVMNPTKPQNPLILSHSSILLPVNTQNPMASFGNSRLCRCYALMTFYPGVKIFTPFTPPVRNLPHPICGSTNCDFAAKTPLFFCGIRYRMISAERSAAFDNSA